MSTFRSRLLRIQRRNYFRGLRTIREHVKPDKAIDRYARDYQRALRSYQSIASKRDLLRRVLASDIVFHGDYHTLKQSQRSVLRVLRDIVGKREVVLCLEMFHSSAQKAVDAYMRGELDEQRFLALVDYAHTWEYAWEHWKPLIDLCRSAAVPILGINSSAADGSAALADRDRHAARIISLAHLRNPGKLIYAVDGDYHMAPSHLPAEVESLLTPLGVHPKRTILYQNAENLYWQLADQGLEEAEALQISEDSFCIMNSTPANKVQSYLNWMEYSADAYYPVNANWEELSDVNDATAVPRLVETICSVLGLPVPAEALQRLDIYYAKNIEFMRVLEQSEQLRPAIRRALRRIKHNEGFLLESTTGQTTSYIIYLPNSSLNMAAEEATHFVNAALRGSASADLAPFDRFYRNAVTECLGFFGSKLINEKRKVQTVHSIRTWLGDFKYVKPSAEDRRRIPIARLILSHRLFECRHADAAALKKRYAAVYRPQSPAFDILSTQLGYMLGNRLYARMKKGTFKIDQVRRLFSMPLDKPDEAFSVYRGLSQSLGECPGERR